MTHETLSQGASPAVQLTKHKPAEPVGVRAGEGRLYRETPVGLTKVRAPKGRGAAAPEPMEGPWELTGTTLEDMVEVGEKLQRSKKDQDRALATQVAFFAPRQSGHSTLLRLATYAVVGFCLRSHLGCAELVQPGLLTGVVGTGTL